MTFPYIVSKYIPSSSSHSLYLDYLPLPRESSASMNIQNYEKTDKKIHIETRIVISRLSPQFLGFGKKYESKTLILGHILVISMSYLRHILYIYWGKSLA